MMVRCVIKAAERSSLAINHENETSLEYSYFLKFQRFIKYSVDKNPIQVECFLAAMKLGVCKMNNVNTILREVMNH